MLSIYHEPMPDFIRTLAQTPEMLRLQGIGMNCGCEYTRFAQYRSCRPYARYEHSIGVALIVWHFTGDPKQAVAGLLHDVSSPAFSHVVDFLKGDYCKQEATEEKTGEIIERSAGIRRVLRTLNLRIEEVSDYHLYPIADNDSPRLSADRLEYTLGNFWGFNTHTRERIAEYYNALTMGKNEDGEDEIMFKEEALATRFALESLENSKRFVHDEDRYAMQYLADLLRQALKRGILTEADLYTTEQRVIEKLRSDDGLRLEWDRFTAFSSLEYRDTKPEGPGWICVSAKRRYIDPYVMDKGRVSALSPKAADAMASFLNRSFDVWMRAQ